MSARKSNARVERLWRVSLLLVMSHVRMHHASYHTHTWMSHVTGVRLVCYSIVLLCEAMSHTRQASYETWRLKHRNVMFKSRRCLIRDICEAMSHMWDYVSYVRLCLIRDICEAMSHMWDYVSYVRLCLIRDIASYETWRLSHRMSDAWHASHRRHDASHIHVSYEWVMGEAYHTHMW